MRNREKGQLSIKMERFMKESGGLEKGQEMGNTFTGITRFMKENGKVL
jgi:hypothetical protein